MFSRIQFTPDVLPSDITGIRYFNPKTQEFELRLGPVHTNILLADEINRATPRHNPVFSRQWKSFRQQLMGKPLQLTDHL